MSNRTKALIAAVISFLTIPGLHRFYLGDTTAGILIILFIWLGVGVIITLIDLVRFLVMSDQAFDAKYSVGFKMKPVNLPILFGILTPVLIILGGVGLFLKDRIICLPDAVARACLLMTEGDNILNAKGMNIPREFAWAIQTLPPYILGLAGIFILGIILKSSNRNA